MGNSILLLLVTICIVQCQINRQDYSKHPQMIPAKLREGNMYYLDVDNIGNYRIFKPVAVMTDQAQVTFGEFQEGKDCVVFATSSGITEKCKHQYYLLHQNFRAFVRKRLVDAMADSKCVLVQFGDSILVTIKYDVAEPKSPKFIGTYSKRRDNLVYIDDKGKRKSVKRVLVQIKSGDLGKDQFDTFCQYLRK
ncbi:unnamed protein product [Cylicocyclus nassatus]|uniref:Uncharacterized protein n=1 Tax=Cylicocyclus nassatus TaxID=53992 RepID=A0AA36LYW8_CYLNA|nr:unnamed protein product [Cylicocyclus nassatus]